MAAAVQQALERKDKPPCLLCGRRSICVVAFVPRDPQAWGLPPGWAGGALYGLCKRCLRLPTVADLAEAALWEDRARLVAAWN
jgi:hypothetical protein